MSESLGQVGEAWISVVADFSRLESQLNSGIQSAATKAAESVSGLGDAAAEAATKGTTQFQRLRDEHGRFVGIGKQKNEELKQSFFEAFNAAHDGAMKSLGPLSTFAGRLGDIGGQVRNLGIGLTAAMTAPVAAIAGVGLSFNAMYEGAQIGFTTMLGSADKAKAFLEDLKTFAAQTPFEFEDLTRASQRLMAMGFHAEDVKGILTSVGNAAAGLNTGREGIDRITLALGQMQGRGKVATQEMNQLTEVGINGWKMLAERFGVSEAKLRSLVEKGVVPADAAVKALIDGMNKQFPDMMDKQSTSFRGLMSTIKDESRFLAGDITKGAFDVLKGPLATFAEKLHDARMQIDAMPDSWKAVGLAGAGMIATVGPALFVGGTIASGISNIIKLSAEMRGVWAGIAGMQGVSAWAGMAQGIGVAAGALGNLKAGVSLIGEAFTTGGLIGGLKGLAAFTVPAWMTAGVFVALAYEVWGLASAWTAMRDAQAKAMADENALANKTQLLSNAKKLGLTQKQGESVGDFNQRVITAEYDRLAKERGVVRNAGESDADYHRRIAEAMRAAAAPKPKAGPGPGGFDFGADADGAKKTADMLKSFGDALRPAEELNRQIALLHQKFSDKEIVAAYAKKIVDAADTQRQHGLAVTGDVGRLESWARAALAAQSEAEKTEKAVNTLKDAFNRHVEPLPMDVNLADIAARAGVPELSKLQKVGLPPDLTTNVQVFGDMAQRAADAEYNARQQAQQLSAAISQMGRAGYTNAQIIAGLGGEIDAAANNAKQFGLKLDPATQALVRQRQAAKASADEAQKWRDVWTQAMGNVVSGFAKGVTGMIFDRKDNAEHVASLQQQITSITNAQEKERLQSAIDHAQQGTKAYEDAQAAMAAFNKRMADEDNAARMAHLAALKQELEDSKSHWHKFAETVKDIFKNLAKTITETMITGAFTKIASGLFGGKEGGIFGALGGLFGHGKDAGGSATNAAGSIGSVASAGVGGAASSIGGIVGGINMISGIGSAAGSIAGAIGTFRLEGTMNAVEYNTRASMIHLNVIIDQLLWPMRGSIDNISSQASTHTAQLDAIYNATMGYLPRATSMPVVVVPVSGGTAAGAGALAAPSVSLQQDITVNIVGGDPAETRKAVLNGLETNIDRFLEIATQRIKLAWNGVVTAPNPA